MSSAAVAAALIRAKITPTIVRADFTGASFVIRMVNESQGLQRQQHSFAHFAADSFYKPSG